MTSGHPVHPIVFLGHRWPAGRDPQSLSLKPQSLPFALGCAPSRQEEGGRERPTCCPLRLLEVSVGSRHRLEHLQTQPHVPYYSVGSTVVTAVSCAKKFHVKMCVYARTRTRGLSARRCPRLSRDPAGCFPDGPGTCARARTRFFKMTG